MRIVYSLDAERDLTELFDYIAQDSGVQRAELVLRRIERTLDTLADWPFIGRVRPELDGEPRSFSVWPWIVIYEPQAAAFTSGVSSTAAAIFHALYKAQTGQRK